ncbi:MAG: hypothetical protein R3F59_24820 [Myxococcota bacterium]
MAATHATNREPQSAAPDLDSEGDDQVTWQSPDAIAGPRAVRTDRSDRMVRYLRRAVELSYPLYTFAELKRVLRCEYHMLVSSLRTESSKTWGELTLLTGMTRAGLNKLGDEVPPRPAHSGIRLLAIVLQEAGPQGLPLPKLAARYYERSPQLDDGPSFEEALRALVDTGEVAEVEGRFVTASHFQANGSALADEIEVTVSRIAGRVREEAGFGVAQLHRVSLRMSSDPEAQRKVLDAMKEAICKVAIEAEAEAEALGGETEYVTVVVGGGRDLL